MRPELLEDYEYPYIDHKIYRDYMRECVEDEIRNVNRNIVVVTDPMSLLIPQIAEVDQRSFEDQGVGFSEWMYRDALNEGMIVFSHVTDADDILSIASAIPGRIFETGGDSGKSHGLLQTAAFCAGDCVDKDAVILERWAAPEQLGAGRRMGLHSELIRAREVWARIFGYTILTGTARYENRPVLNSAMGGDSPPLRYAIGREAYQRQGRSTGAGFAIVGSAKASTLKNVYGPSPAGDRLLLFKALKFGSLGDFLWRTGINMPRTVDYVIGYDELVEEGMQTELPQVLVQAPPEDTITPEYRRIVDDLLGIGYIGVSSEMVDPSYRQEMRYLRMIHVDALPPAADTFLQARKKVLEKLREGAIGPWLTNTPPL